MQDEPPRTSPPPRSEPTKTQMIPAGTDVKIKLLRSLADILDSLALNFTGEAKHLLWVLIERLKTLPPGTQFAEYIDRLREVLGQLKDVGARAQVEATLAVIGKAWCDPAYLRCAIEDSRVPDGAGMLADSRKGIVINETESNVASGEMFQDMSLVDFLKLLPPGTKLVSITVAGKTTNP